VIIKVRERKKFEDELLASKRAAEDALRKNESLVKLTHELESHKMLLDQKVSQLSSINRNLIEFNKIITHDFQESIRKVELFAGRIESNPADVAKIVVSARRLRALTSALELFVDLEREQSYSRVDLTTLLDEAKAEVLVATDFSDFDLEVSPLPVLEGSRQQLKLMFYELLANAITFRKHDRRLKVSVSARKIQENVYKSEQDYKYEDYLRIDFKDNGKGFDEQYNEYVFGLLKKLDADNTHLGMGLGYIKKIVDNHHGTISVQAKSDEGATFFITLPFKQSQKMAAANHPA
jgi:sigma-B regulation protein RsbU (phosphoserine phosphatase)